MDVFLVIAPSIISGLFAVAVCQISQASARKENIQIMEQKMAIFEVKFDALKTSVDKHNELVERMYKCEETIAIHDAKIGENTRKIEDLQDAIKA